MTHTIVRRTPSVALSVVLALGAVAAVPGPAHATTPWPGGSTVTGADPVGLGSNVSGLAYVASGSAARGTMWAVRNSPSELLRLAPVTGGWDAGTSRWTLGYPSGLGAPDAEGVTVTGTAGEVYVVSERDGSGSSRPSVLRYTPGAPGTISATTEWDLSTDLPGLGSNTGPEGIVWVPDSHLTASGFVDQSTGAPYQPSTYPGHGAGLFLVGIEQTGQVLAYALMSGGVSHRVAAFASGFPSVMELSWDAGTRTLRALCDDGCDGQSATFRVRTAAGAGRGTFQSTAVVDRPSGMADLNNEGFAVAPAAECVAGRRPAYWADDSATDGVALRAGTIACPTPTACRRPRPSPGSTSTASGPGCGSRV